jgi:hypothetical protein
MWSSRKRRRERVQGNRETKWLYSVATLPVQTTAPFRSVPELGGDVSCVSVGGLMLVIWAAESRRPAPSRCRNVDSSTCSRTRSSQPLPPCHTSPTWWLRMGRLHTKQMAVIVLQSAQQPPGVSGSKTLRHSWRGNKTTIVFWNVASSSLLSIDRRFRAMMVTPVSIYHVTWRNIP